MGDDRMRKRVRHAGTWAVVLTLVLACGACTTMPPATEMPSGIERTGLQLRPGDEIDVKFRYWPDLDETQIIRPDGMISLQLVQDVPAAGMSPGELRDKLVALYAARIKDPEIAVIVRNLASQNVYVAGQVRAPGLVPMEGELTALEAVMAAGGFTGAPRNAMVLRRVGDTRQARAVNLKQPLHQAESTDFHLEPNDIVYVPRTPIENVNEWVDKYLNRTIPTDLIYAIDTIDRISDRGDTSDSATASYSLSNLSDIISPAAAAPQP